jgi:2-polyprenyl-3-methyl-5-hydroxy-6-metoxy-1,4-benzoquinol methylase
MLRREEAGETHRHKGTEGKEKNFVPLCLCPFVPTCAVQATRKIMIFNFFFPDLSSRSNEPELMDMEYVDEKKLIHTVEQFKLVNLLFTSSRSLMKTFIYPDMRKGHSEEYTFLDIGAGGCDLAIWFLQFTKRKKLPVRFTCLDYDPRIVAYAREKCKGYPEIEIVQDSVFNLDSFPDFDYVFSNHFLHHLSYSDVLKIIPLIHRKTRRVFLLNDIERSRLSYAGYTLFSGLFFHNSLAFYDGRLSIKKAFTYRELETAIKGFSCQDIKTFQKKPSRLVIHCQKETSPKLP